MDARTCPHGDKNVATLNFYLQVRVDHLATWHADRLAMSIERKHPLKTNKSKRLRGSVE